MLQVVAFGMQVHLICSSPCSKVIIQGIEKQLAWPLVYPLVSALVGQGAQSHIAILFCMNPYAS